jgi:hypothetical protein
MIFSFCGGLGVKARLQKPALSAAEGCRHSLLLVILSEDAPKRRASELKDLQLI